MVTGVQTCALQIWKWHLGHLKEFLPLQQGFDEYLGLPCSNDMWPVFYDGTPMNSSVNTRKSGYPPLPLIEGNEKIKELKTIDDQSELTTIYTERAVRFITENKKNPFFLYMAHSMCHVPLAVSGKFKGKSQQGMFGDVIMEIDGVSILPLLLGDVNANPRETFLYYYRKNNLEGIRKGNWKLVFAHPGRTYHGFQPGTDGFPGKVNENFSFEEGLYDLRRDPGEQHDVKEFYPEIVTEPKKLADEAREDLGDDLTGNPGKNRREPGKINN